MPEDNTLVALARRVSPRAAVRTFFLLYFAFLCWRLWAFYLWAVGQGPYVPRPEAVAGLIPVGAYMSLFLWLKSGWFDVVAPAGIVIILGAVATSLVFKRGFCGWICPVGTVWHGFAWLGTRFKALLPKSYRRLPVGPKARKAVDWTLRGLRYVIAAMLLFWVGRVSVQEAYGFQQIPYYAVSDIKILSLLVRITPTYLMVAGSVAALSMLFGNVWCRYLCPLGGYYGAIGAASACTVVRDPAVCTSCRRCTKACHARVAVHTSRSVRDPECDGCMDCLIACPERGALQARAFGKLPIAWWVWPLGVIGLWLFVYALAVASGHWSTSLLPDQLAAYVRAMGI